MKVVILFFIFLAFGCSSNQSESGDSVSSEALLNEIIERMETESINRIDIDWDDFREQVFEVANQPVTDSSKFHGYERSTLLAIRKALELLDDGHSIYRSTYGQEFRSRVPNRSCIAPNPEVSDIPENIGYLKVSGTRAISYEATGYSASLQNRIKEQDNENTIGWIIDLRGNTGGNMTPMFAGLSSILGEVVTGYFIDPEGNKVMHEIVDNAFWIDGDPTHTLSEPMYELINESPNVAVLIDNIVASAGEAVAVSFKKRPNTKFFGTQTCGISTANYGAPLSNGGMLILTVSTMADIEKELYGGPILPDVLIEDPSEVVEQAVEWLYSL